MDLTALAAELVAGHPVTGSYDSDDALAAGELNVLNRPGDVTIADMIKFLLMDNTHSTDGDDTQDRAILTRMRDVVAMAVTPTAAAANPWGSTAIGTITEIQQIKTHQLVNYFDLYAQGNLPVDLTDTNFQVYLAGAEASGCMSAAQETALLVLGNNLKSRATELGLGIVRTGDVQRARGL